MNSNQTLTKLIVATVAVIGVTALVWYFGFSGTSAKSEENEEQPKSKTKKLDNESATEKKVAPKKESKVVPQEPAPKKVEVVVEDASDDEEEDEQAEGEVDPEAEELAEIKTKYDDANRLAAKYITGMKYEKAIEKLTEAIELAPRVSNSGKSTVTLYNNRSAMYEKTNTYDKSLSDITVILTLDPFHVKSRLRKARILEAQGKEQQAVDENMICALIQQRMGEAPSAQQKIDEIAKNMALKQAPAIFQKLRAVAQEFPLPSKSHIRNYFESFPSMQAWYDVYRRQDRTAVEIELADAKATDATPSVLLQKTLALVCFDLVNGNFEKGFELLKEARALESSFPAAREAARNTVVDANGLPAFNDAAPLVYLAPATLVVVEGEENVDVDRQLLSLLHLLVGVELHMRCQLDAATASYKLSVLFYPNNMDGRLTLFNAYLEQGNLEKCLEIVNDVIAHLEARKATLTEADSEQAEVNDILKSWALLHRITAHVTRNDAGAYSPTAISDAQSDLSTALALAEQYKSTSAVAKAAIVTGLIRSIHILVQNKPMAGGQTTEEDMEECNKNLQYAKSLNPTNPMVLIMEVELLNSMGKGDEALEILETIERKAQAAVASGNTSSEYAAFVDDCTPYIVRASNRVNKAMMLIQTEMGSYDAQQQMTTLLEEADKLYKRALEIEPSAVEVLNQYAQYLSGFRGQFEEAIVLLKKAISVARTKDDVQELQQLLIVNEAQDRAVKFFQSMAPP